MPVGVGESEGLAEFGLRQGERAEEFAQRGRGGEAGRRVLQDEAGEAGRGPRRQDQGDGRAPGVAHDQGVPQARASRKPAIGVLFALDRSGEILTRQANLPAKALYWPLLGVIVLAATVGVFFGVGW
ncbi:hypothetical protein [Streptomyces sp. 4F14]|uniref:hypothetical protein n=1 Tax=Streptomyces sp. 4F14 TaxID=3394380 RepID=UPI003A88B6BE